MKYVFIVNPSAGNGRAAQISENIINVCGRDRLDYIMHYTNGPKEATAITESYKNETNIIYSVGGDGTLSEIVNGIVGTRNMLGVIPAGSGNDFYKSLLKVSEDELKIDVGRVNDTYFINVLSMGIDAEVGANVARFKDRKLIPNSQIYNFSIIYTLIKFKANKMKFMLNNQSRENKYTIVTVCNGGYYGNGYNIAPDAVMNDRLFDIYFVDKISKFSVMKLVPKLKKGTHEGHKNIHKEQADRIHIQSEKEIICNVDGEIFADKEFDIELIPDALTIYNNKDLVKIFLKGERS